MSDDQSGPGPPSAPPWRLVVSRFSEKTWRGWRRLWRGCTLQHSPDLRRTRQNGVLYLECPRCDLLVRPVLPGLERRIRRWDEVGYQISHSKKTLDGRNRFNTK
jgi:hypothetical protein